MNFVQSDPPFMAVCKKKDRKLKKLQKTKHMDQILKNEAITMPPIPPLIWDFFKYNYI